mgnify:FL=1
MGIEPMLVQHLWNTDYKSVGASNYTNLPFKFGIEGGTRTLTPLLATDFKSVVSAIPPLRHYQKSIPIFRRIGNLVHYENNLNHRMIFVQIIFDVRQSITMYYNVRQYITL